VKDNTQLHLAWLQWMGQMGASHSCYSVTYCAHTSPFSELWGGHVLCTRQSVQWAVGRLRTVHTTVRSVSCGAATFCAHGSPFSELWGWPVPIRHNHRYSDSDFCPFSFQARILPSIDRPWPHCSTFLHTQHLVKSSVKTQSLNNRRNNQTVDECE